MFPHFFFLVKNDDQILFTFLSFQTMSKFRRFEEEKKNILQKDQKIKISIKLQIFNRIAQDELI